MNKRLAISNEPDGNEKRYPHGWWIIPTVFFELCCIALAALIFYVRSL